MCRLNERCVFVVVRSCGCSYIHVVALMPLQMNANQDNDDEEGTLIHLYLSPALFTVCLVCNSHASTNDDG